MAYFYILYSEQKDKYYVGSTRNNVEDRLKRHLSKHTGFTSQSKDWIIVYKEFYEDYSKALQREKEVKLWKSRKLIENLLNSVG